MTRVLIVDDHPLFRQGLRRVIDDQPDMTVCAEAEESTEALEAIESALPDIAVVDLCLKGRSGLELIGDIKTLRPKLPVLMLSMYDESLYAERAIRAGAAGYVTKDEAAGEVIGAIRRVLAGHVHLSPVLCSSMVRRAATADDVSPAPAAEAAGAPRHGARPDASGVQLLTDRELEVFELIGQGLSNRRIAERLFRSIKTVESHRENIKVKLGIASSGQLLRYAVEHSLRLPAAADPDAGAQERP